MRFQARVWERVETTDLITLLASHAAFCVRCTILISGFYAMITLIYNFNHFVDYLIQLGFFDAACPI